MNFEEIEKLAWNNSIIAIKGKGDNKSDQVSHIILIHALKKEKEEFVGTFWDEVHFYGQMIAWIYEHGIPRDSVSWTKE